MKNVVVHRLTVQPLVGDTVLTWDSVSGWPTVGDFPIRLDRPDGTVSEIVLCTSVNVGANQTTVTRAQEGTSASGSFIVNSTGANTPTAQMLIDGFARLDTALSQSLTGPLKVPTALGGSYAATSYGSMPVKLGEIVTTAGQVNPSFSSIPATFRALRLRFTARDNGAGTTFSNLPLQLNADATAIYDDQIILITGSTVTGAELASQTTVRIGTITNGAATASMISSGVVEFPNYADTNFFKKFICTCEETHIVGTGPNVIHVTKGQYRSANAINALALNATFAANCLIVLEGLP